MSQKAQKSRLFLLKASVATGLLVGSSFAFAEAQPESRNLPANQPDTPPTIQPTSPATTTPAGAPEGQASQRKLFVANLQPVNPSVASEVMGIAQMVIEGDRLGVNLGVSGLAPNVAHEQVIRKGTTCPSQTADMNKDGIVDRVEAEAGTGNPVLLFTMTGQQASDPSAASVSTQAYPMASANGNIAYINIFPLSQIASLFTDSAPGSSISLKNHVVEIYGVAENAQLPSTVQGKGGMSAHQSLPVACGVIQEVNE